MVAKRAAAGASRAPGARVPRAGPAPPLQARAGTGTALGWAGVGRRRRRGVGGGRVRCERSGTCSPRARHAGRAPPVRGMGVLVGSTPAGASPNSSAPWGESLWCGISQSRGTVTLRCRGWGFCAREPHQGSGLLPE